MSQPSVILDLMELTVAITRTTTCDFFFCSCIKDNWRWWDNESPGANPNEPEPIPQRKRKQLATKNTHDKNTRSSPTSTKQHTKPIPNQKNNKYKAYTTFIMFIILTLKNLHFPKISGRRFQHLQLPEFLLVVFFWWVVIRCLWWNWCFMFTIGAHCEIISFLVGKNDW